MKRIAMANQSIFQRLRRWISIAAAVSMVLVGMVGMLLVMANWVDEAMRMAVTKFAAPMLAAEEPVSHAGRCVKIRSAEETAPGIGACR